MPSERFANQGHLLFPACTPSVLELEGRKRLALLLRLDSPGSQSTSLCTFSDPELLGTPAALRKWDILIQNSPLPPCSVPILGLLSPLKCPGWAHSDVVQ